MLKKIRSFARRERTMTKTQQEAFTLFGRFGLELSNNIIDLPNIFGRIAPVVVEIGFGTGQSLAETALKNPDRDYIGIEVYRPGIAALLARVAQHNLTNIRIYNADAVDVLRTCIPDYSIDQVQIFFPDPWPKRRHHKRRLIQAAFVALIYSKLKANGCLHIATDWEDYAKHILRIMSATSGFSSVSKTPYRPATKFEQRGIRSGRRIWDLMFERGI